MVPRHFEVQDAVPPLVGVRRVSDVGTKRLATGQIGLDGRAGRGHESNTEQIERMTRPPIFDLSRWHVVFGVKALAQPSLVQA